MKPGVFLRDVVKRDPASGVGYLVQMEMLYTLVRMARRSGTGVVGVARR